MENKAAKSIAIAVSKSAINTWDPHKDSLREHIAKEIVDYLGSMGYLLSQPDVLGGGSMNWMKEGQIAERTRIRKAVETSDEHLTSKSGVRLMFISDVLAIIDGKGSDEC